MRSPILLRIIALPAFLVFAELDNLLDLVVLARPPATLLWVKGQSEPDGPTVKMVANMYPQWPKCLDDRNPDEWTYACTGRRNYTQVAHFRFSEVTTEPRTFWMAPDGTNVISVSRTIAT
jgi:hypothetical protein